MPADTMRDKTDLLVLMLARHQPSRTQKCHETTFQPGFRKISCNTTYLEYSSDRRTNTVSRRVAQSCPEFEIKWEEEMLFSESRYVLSVAALTTGLMASAGAGSAAELTFWSMWNET